MKQFLAVVLSLGLLFSAAEPAFAGKGYSSGRSSFSGRSSTGSSSFSGKSYSSGSGKSYSSGSSYKPSTPSYTPKPSYTPPKSSSPSYSSGSKSYSSGSKPSSPPSYTPSNSGKSYSPGSSNPSTSSSRKPTGSTFNDDLTSSAKKQQSQYRYEAATKPKPSYTTPKGETKTIKEDSPSVGSVRRYVTHERYVTYDNRSTTFYQGYSPQPYNDFFSPFLMGYLFSSAVNNNDRASWAYHHKDQMDQARYEAMLAKDAELKARIEALEKQGVPRDPNYVVPGMAENPDLQYSKEFVDAAYNPVEVEQPSEYHGGGEAVAMWIVIIFIVLVVGGLAVYYLFVKEF